MYNNNTTTSKQIVQYMKQIVGHTTTKKAKYIKKCIASLTNEYTGKKIGIKKSRNIFSKYIGRILQHEYSDKYKFKQNKFLEIKYRLINA
jgi:hypothetical protein